MKKCLKCKFYRSTHEFYPDKSRKDGLRDRCKSCCRIEGRISAKTERGRESRRKASCKFYYSDKGKEYSKIYSKSEGAKTTAKKYATANASKLASKAMARHAKKIRATPIWLTRLHFEQIQIFYDSAHSLTEELGIKFEVDHIVPLQGDGVCGLHVPWNLQVITRSENRSKGNTVCG